MKKLFQAKNLTMLCFLLLLGLLFQRGVPHVCRGFASAIHQYKLTGTVDFSIVEEEYNQNFSAKYHFINLNGAYQKLMGAKVVNERYLLDNGHLTYVIGEYDMEGIARNTVDFRNALSALDIPMFYVNAPFKIHRTHKQLPKNAQDYSNENADCFLACLREENVPVLDLRERIDAESLDHYGMFYKSDHHWTTEAALWAAGEITEYLSGWDPNYAVPQGILDPSGYTYEVYEDIFLGSAGKRVGGLYSGMDDYTVITPAYDTAFTFSAENGAIIREGSFSDAFLIRENLYPEDPLSSNVYQTYCGNGYGQMRILNHSADACSPKKILLIRDSFSDVLAPFLSLGYTRLDVLDLRSFHGDVLDYVRQTAPDAVLVVYNPGAYENNNLVMFDFLTVPET